MKITRFLVSALCCMFVSVNAFAKASGSEISKPEVIEGKSANIYKYSLKNGIPVYYVENTSNSVDEVSIIVKGGRTYLKPEESGLEDALFTMMSNSSSHYNYIKRQQLAYEKRVKIDSYSIDNASVLYVNCINYYLKDMLPVLTDSFMNPTFPKPVYENVMTAYNQKIKETAGDPYELLLKTVSDNVYKGHLYEAQTTPTQESLQNLTIDAMKKWHKTVLDSRRIFVIAVSSMKPEELINQLNSSIGTIKALSTKLPENQIEKPVLAGEPLIVTSESAAGSGYAAYAVQAPSYKDDDYLAAALASTIYSTTLYNVVRTKYGACYSPYSDIEERDANYSSEIFYRISNPKGITSYALQARKIMASGKYIVKNNEDGSYEFGSISEVLPGSKNSVVSQMYSIATSTDGRLRLYVYGLVNYQDITAYDSMIDKIHSVKAEDVVRVFNKYWVEQPGRWFALVGPESENAIEFE